MSQTTNQASTNITLIILIINTESLIFSFLTKQTRTQAEDSFRFFYLDYSGKQNTVFRRGRRQTFPLSTLPQVLFMSRVLTDILLTQKLTNIQLSSYTHTKINQNTISSTGIWEEQVMFLIHSVKFHLLLVVQLNNFI